MSIKRSSSQWTAKEILKDILLLLLLCSAFFLLWEAQLLAGLLGTPDGNESTLPTEVQVYQIQAEAARPIRMAVVTGRNAIYGVQYDNPSVDTIFQQSSNLLREALGSLDTPIVLSEREWQQMLSTSPGLYFDMMGDIPLSVLSGWLSGQETSALTASPRRLLLTTYNGLVALCYQVGEDGFYCATTQVVDVERLQSVVSGYTANDSQFAFQLEGYREVDPYTMVFGMSPTPLVYKVENPTVTAESRTQLITALKLNDQNSAVYTTTDGQGIVLRRDTDTLRLYGNGIVTYQGEAGMSPYPVASSYTIPTAFEVVEECRSMMSTALLPFCGDARIHLLSVTQEENRWTVDFGYTINGSPVQFSDGEMAAQFIVEDGEILEFTLRLRRYTPTLDTTIPLPQIQAVAAMEALDYHRQELVLSYYDNGGGLISADWTAHNR